MNQDMPNDPEEVNKMLSGPMGVWQEGDKVVLKAAMPNGEPVKLSSKEAKDLAQMLITFAEQVEKINK